MNILFRTTNLLLILLFSLKGYGFYTGRSKSFNSVETILNFGLYSNSKLIKLYDSSTSQSTSIDFKVISVVPSYYPLSQLKTYEVGLSVFTSCCCPGGCTMSNTVCNTTMSNKNATYSELFSIPFDKCAIGASASVCAGVKYTKKDTYFTATTMQYVDTMVIYSINGTIDSCLVGSTCNFMGQSDDTALIFTAANYDPSLLTLSFPSINVNGSSLFVLDAWFDDEMTCSGSYIGWYKDGCENFDNVNKVDITNCSDGNGIVWTNTLSWNQIGPSQKMSWKIIRNKESCGTKSQKTSETLYDIGNNSISYPSNTGTYYMTDYNGIVEVTIKNGLICISQNSFCTSNEGTFSSNGNLYYVNPSSGLSICNYIEGSNYKYRFMMDMTNSAFSLVSTRYVDSSNTGTLNLANINFQCGVLNVTFTSNNNYGECIYKCDLSSYANFNISKGQNTLFESCKTIYFYCSGIDKQINCEGQAIEDDPPNPTNSTNSEGIGQSDFSFTSIYMIFVYVLIVIIISIVVLFSIKKGKESIGMSIYHSIKKKLKNNKKIQDTNTQENEVKESKEDPLLIDSEKYPTLGSPAN